MKRTDQPTGQYKINPNPSPNTKYVLIYYAINAGPFFSLDPKLMLVSQFLELYDNYTYITRTYIKMQIASLRSLDRLEFASRKCSPAQNALL